MGGGEHRKKKKTSSAFTPFPPPLRKHEERNQERLPLRLLERRLDALPSSYPWLLP